MYGVYAVRFGASTLVLWELGLYLRETRYTRFLKDFLAGTQFTLYTKARAGVAW